MPTLLHGIKFSILDLVRASHVGVLNESVSPVFRVQRFTTLHYSVKKFEPGDLPLVDLVVLFNVRGERSSKPFMGSNCHVHRFGSEPYGVNANHRNRSRRKVA